IRRRESSTARSAGIARIVKECLASITYRRNETPSPSGAWNGIFRGLGAQSRRQSGAYLDLNLGPAGRIRLGFISLIWVFLWWGIKSTVTKRKGAALKRLQSPSWICFPGKLCTPKDL